MLYPIITRAKQWWQPKAGNLLSAVYLAIFIFNIDFQTASKLIIPAITTILGIGLFGYFFNDFTDLESDKKANKGNMLEKLSNSNRFLLLLSALVLAISPWMLLPFDVLSISLLLGEFVLLLVYAIPPIRIKEKGFIALITDALYAYAIPFIIAFHTFNLVSPSKINWLLYVTFFCWQFFIGLVNILIHQMEDYQNDLLTNTKTWVTAIGKVKARQFLLFFFWPLMVILFVLIIAIISVDFFTWYFIFPILFLFFQYSNLFYKKTYRAFVNSNLTYDLQKINIHYHLFLPYWHILILIFIDFKFIIVLFGHYFLFNFNRIIWWFKAVIYPNLVKYIVVTIPSRIVNFSIYYFRIFILQESPKQARREHYEVYQKEKIDRINKKSNSNVAIVSVNQSKYTETFIQQHENFLLDAGYYLHRFYGGYLPTNELKRGALLSSNASIRKFQEWKTVFFEKDQNDNLKKAFIDYLIHNNINVVLAEFGQSGAEISNLCEAAGVPLIVVYYGYDAHHKKVLDQYCEQYKQMFSYASRIIGVSKDIIHKLELLGAPSDKLVYLPCAIDLNRFIYQDHSQNKPIFLAVGRFTETKSPHLTILAFNEVLKEIPTAKLILIGKDGGGELFEACHILVKALQIEANVIFKGICTPGEVLEQMKLARVFVQHSLTTPLNNDKEGTPVAIMEAMACGLPVVSTRHAGIEELIISEENGFLVNEYDYLNMAKMMILVCKNDQLIYQIGKNASASILKNDLILHNKNLLLHQVDKFILKND